MRFTIYNLLNDNDKNEFQLWTKALQTRERAKLNAKIDMLSQHGEDLYPETLAGTSVAGIQKLRVHGGIQLRPLLCRGPLLDDQTKLIENGYTLLMGAKEVGNKWQPASAPEKADKQKQLLLAGILKRCPHERVG
ncbi:hypothetical protein [Thiolinea disciformis]|uniref:hypothetical protein n=1 Tax=Thiolinea disciformis TaxID=125614 RepID=UPI0003771118|nr:hypothetical protein [Thiolinea disciformis]